MLFKRPVTQSEQLQTTEDDYHREDNGDYEPEVDDYDEADAEQPAQTPSQRTNPFPMKKTFSGLSSPSPVAATAVPIAAPTAPEVQPPSPATITTAPAAPQQEADHRRDPKLIQLTVRIDRALHGRVRYMTFKTGMNQSAIIENLIRLHCPEVP